MEYSNEVLKIVEGALKSDKAKVMSYVRLLIDKLRANNETRIANSLNKVLTSSMSNMSLNSVNDIVKIPLDQESRLPMADISLPEQLADVKLILNQSAQEQVDKFLEYYSNTDMLVNAGIRVPNTILLYGPPGCGKSKLANYLCNRIELPLVTARIDGLISSYLGSTAKNIRTIFEYAQTVPCILFLDEFDALAKVRDDSNELGELKRVVNSLLQNIDNLQNGSIIIAATNHEKLLDPAVWRRFGFKILIEKPDSTSRTKLVNTFIEDHVITDKEMKAISLAFQDMTGADIEEICNKSTIDALIGSEQLNLAIIFKNFFDFISPRLSLSKDMTEKEINYLKTIYLRGIDEKVFSYSQIADILNVSKTYIASIIKEKPENG